MARSHSSGSPNQGESNSPLMVRLDPDSKELLARAAALRHISISAYVRAVTVPQARRVVLAAAEQVIALTPEEQLTFWNALSQPARLTAAQKRLGKLMRGGS